ncbi:sulfur carrier protein ThiS [Microbulbifer yueqingensis]|uniref:Sulfur carrier protein ThiS n=1 Tax=Microbulbifer yueqingensis TaxID=658219 RepID=A0A1G8UPX9_9GAMM|nr:sulfur carrier protein ThiS [Microbulbifer yueqingensis]SDJ55769.1 sulfur carrier protein ThiS [Microbulbifer yueqingensis]
MSEITINAERHSLQGRPSLAALLEQAGYKGDGFAVAVNGEFVPRADYAHTEIRPGDEVDVVAPVVGG